MYIMVRPTSKKYRMVVIIILIFCANYFNNMIIISITRVVSGLRSPILDLALVLVLDRVSVPSQTKSNTIMSWNEVLPKNIGEKLALGFT